MLAVILILGIIALIAVPNIVEVKSTASLTNETYTATKIDSSDSLTIVDGNSVESPSFKATYVNGDVVYYNPVSGSKCTVSDYTANTNASMTGNKTGCSFGWIYDRTNN